MVRLGTETLFVTRASVNHPSYRGDSQKAGRQYGTSVVIFDSSWNLHINPIGYEKGH